MTFFVSDHNQGQESQSDDIDNHRNRENYESNDTRGRNLVRNRDRFIPPLGVQSTHTGQRVKANENFITQQNFQFLQMKQNQNYSQEWNRKFENDSHYVYTDASIKNNASSIGVYHGPNHPLNRSERLTEVVTDNNLAEIKAATEAVEDLIKWNDLGGKKVVIRTDSLCLVNGIKNGSSWKYSHELSNLKNLCSQLPNGVNFQHVYAHDAQDPDPGNEAADILSRQAVNANMFQHRRDRSRERNRSLSRSNDPEHIRSHSAEVAPRKQPPHVQRARSEAPERTRESAGMCKGGILLIGESIGNKNKGILKENGKPNEFVVTKAPTLKSSKPSLQQIQKSTLNKTQYYSAKSQQSTTPFNGAKKK